MPSGYNPVPYGQGVPNRGTAETSLDGWNQQFRASDLYQSFMRRHGLPTDGRVRLSRQQQSALEAELRAAGMQIPGGMHIDQGGNLNQKNRLVRNSLITAGAVGGGLAGLGAAGIGPFSGLAGGGAAGSAGTSAGASGSLAPIAGGSPWALTPYAGTAAMSPTGAAAAGGSIGAGAAAGGAAAAGGGLKGMFTGLTARDLMALAGSGISTVGALTQDPSNLSPNTATDDPRLRRLLDSMQGRLDKSEPLYDSIMAMANGLLPTRYQRGGNGGPF